MSNILDKIKLSGTTYDIVDSTAVHSLDGYYTSGQTNDAITAATTALAETIGNMHYQTSGDVQSAITEATSGMNATLTAHTADTTIHVTSSDKETWNAKADISDIPSVSGYADSVKYNSTSKYVEFYHGGTGGTKVFEYDASPFLIDGMVQNVEIVDYQSQAPSIADDKVKVTWADGYNETHDVDDGGIGDGSEHNHLNFVKLEFGKLTQLPEQNYLVTGDDCYALSSVTYCDTAVFSGNDFKSGFKLEEIYFFADSPSGFTCEEGYQSDFLSEVYDGCETYDTVPATYPIYVKNLSNYSSQSITIDETPTTWGAFFGNRLQEIPTIKALKITFNTDAGKQDIIIPLTEIFDPSNYYTTAETDNKIAEATSGKADTSAVTASIEAAVSGKADSSTVNGINDTLTAHTANTDIHVTTTDKSTWSGKQDALVSGTNIKTINNQSILGSGNIDVQTLPTVSGTMLIFS